MHIFNSFFLGLKELRYETLATLSDKDKRQLNRISSSTTQFIRDIYLIDMFTTEEKERLHKIAPVQNAIPFMIGLMENLNYMDDVCRSLKKEGIQHFESDALAHFMKSKNANPVIVSMVMTYLRAQHDVIDRVEIKPNESHFAEPITEDPQPVAVEEPVVKRRGRKKKE